MRASAYSGITESGRNSPTKRNVYTAEWPRTRRRATGKAISRPNSTESAAAATEYSTVLSNSTPRSAPFHAPLKLLVTGEPGVRGEDRKWDGDSNASMIAYRTGREAPRADQLVRNQQRQDVLPDGDRDHEDQAGDDALLEAR